MEAPIKITGTKTGEIGLSPALPSLYGPASIPGVKNLIAKGRFGSLHLQQITGNGYSIWYHNYLLKEEDIVTFTWGRPILRLWFALKRSFYYTLDGLGTNVLHERGFNIHYAPSLSQTFHLQGQQPYSYIGIHFSLEYLEQLAHLFPGVEEFLQNIPKSPALLHPVNQIADIEMLTVIEDILYCTYPIAIRRKYLDYRIQEILLLALRKMTHNPRPATPPLSEQAVERVYKAADLLTGNLTRNYTLPELGILVGLNIYQLKKGFKTIYDLTIPEFLHEARMQKARLLLEETDMSVARVAADIGYSHPFAFSSAFKKNFGYAPSLILRSRKRQTANFS
jgi:AraC-like DNA-binding protein